MNADDIKKLRHKLGLTQEQLAHKIGVAFTSISRWENGRTKPSPLAQYALMRLKADLLNFK